MLRELLLWWTMQMRALLPRRLVSDARSTDALIVAADGTPDAPQIRLSLRRRRREIPLGRFRIDAAGQRAAKAAIRQRPRRVVLQPDSSALLEREVALPLAAERDLKRVLSYEMDRLTPFTAEQVFWSAAVERRDRATGRLEVCLSLVPKTLLQPILATLDRIRVVPGAIEAISRTGDVRHIDLLETHRRWWSPIAVAAGLAVAFAVAVPFVTQSFARDAIEARIAALQPRIVQVEALRQRIAAGSAGSDVVAAERTHSGDALQVLATVTDLLPDGTVLTDLSLRTGQLTIGGRSVTAAQLIPALAADPTVRNPAFVAPVTRTPDGKADTFVIRAELSP